MGSRRERPGLGELSQRSSPELVETTLVKVFLEKAVDSKAADDYPVLDCTRRCRPLDLTRGELH